MEYQINENVVAVCGAVNAAIYDFSSGKIYSINNIGKNILLKYIGEAELNIDEKIYLSKLEEKKLISHEFIPYEIKNIGSIPKPKLEMAWLEVTELCNLKCVHCYEGKCHKKFDNSLSYEDWINVINQLSELNVKRIILIGGEPCCYRRIEDLINYCGKKSIDTTFFTNATLMNDSLISSIGRNKAKVKISIYGGDAESHDRVTSIKGSFAMMDSNILKMKSKGISMSASVILMKENQNDLEKIKEYLSKRGVKHAGYDVIRNVFGGEQSIHAPTNSKIVGPKYFSRPNFKADLNTYKRNHFVNSCWFGKIAIQENGNVLPCVFHRNVSMGNVRENTIVNIINSKQTKDFWYLAFENINECDICEYRYACKDCRPVAFGVSGFMKEKNPRCLYSPSIGKWGSLKTK